jgi:malate/lactate dehydrogenase
MRRKITVIGAGQVAVTTALLLAKRDVADLVLLGAGDGVADDVAAAVSPYGAAPGVIRGTWPDTAGSDVVVLAGVPSDSAAQIAERCPRAVLVVVTDEVVEDVETVLGATGFQRARVLGVPADGPLARAAGAERIVDAVLFDRGREHWCAVRLNGEQGASGVRLARVLVGGEGVADIL